jgi:tellurite resistance protein
MTKLVALAANETALSAKSDGNTTKAERIKTMAAKAQTKLDAFTSNTTLMTACTAIDTAKAEKKTAKENGEWEMVSLKSSTDFIQQALLSKMPPLPALPLPPLLRRSLPRG